MNDGLSDDQHVLVLGASGYVGSHLVPRLIERGFRVRASARDAEVLEARGWDCEAVAADALRPETLAPALEGIDVAYYLVHSMAAGRDFAERDRRAAD
ncbi:MAG: NAD-dependent epimerase/dehydratase family protein, partial [Dehalococcoidia bacterium]